MFPLPKFGNDSKQVLHNVLDFLFYISFFSLFNFTLMHVSLLFTFYLFIIPYNFTFILYTYKLYYTSFSQMFYCALTEIISNKFSINSLIIVICVSSSYKFQLKDAESKVFLHFLNLNFCQFRLDIDNCSRAPSAASLLIPLNPLWHCQSVRSALQIMRHEAADLSLLLCIRYLLG